MIDKEQILKIAKNAVLGKKFVVIDVKVKPVNCFTVFLDSLEGISINDCATVSRFIEKNLNREVEDYELNVSSVGIDKPLTSKIQFLKNIGKIVEVLLNDNKKLKGVLKAYNDSSIILTISRKEKSPVTKKTVLVDSELEIKLNKIRTVITVVSFNKKNHGKFEFN